MDLVLRRNESWAYFVVMGVEDRSKVTGKAVNTADLGGQFGA